MFFPEPAHFEQQDIEMQLLKNISKKQLGEECALSRAAPKPPWRGGARLSPRRPGSGLLCEASVSAPSSPSPSFHCFPPNPDFQWPLSWEPYSDTHPGAPALEGAGVSCLRLLRVRGPFVFLLQQVVRRDRREQSSVSWPDGLEFGSWIRPGPAIVAETGSWHLPCPPTAGCLGMRRVPRDAPNAQGCSSLGSPGMVWFGAQRDAPVQGRGWTRHLCIPLGLEPWAGCDP